MADHVYAENDVSLWRPKDETKGGPTWQVSARMHKAITVMMLKAEAAVIARNPDFQLQGRDFLHHIDYEAGTVGLRRQDLLHAGLSVSHGRSG